jgi:hypothetical protein
MPRALQSAAEDRRISLRLELLSASGVERRADAGVAEALTHLGGFMRCSDAFRRMLLSPGDASHAPGAEGGPGGAGPARLSMGAHGPAAAPVAECGPADASQRGALLAAASGVSFVCRGPPGCGKTSTLSNVVTALAAQGKRVLVVAKVPTWRTYLPVLA